MTLPIKINNNFNNKLFTRFFPIITKNGADYEVGKEYWYEWNLVFCNRIKCEYKEEMMLYDVPAPYFYFVFEKEKEVFLRDKANCKVTLVVFRQLIDF